MPVKANAPSDPFSNSVAVNEATGVVELDDIHLPIGILVVLLIDYRLVIQRNHLLSRQK